MDCCSAPDPAPRPTGPRPCPSCGRPGRPVPAVTIERLAVPGTRWDPGERHRFCATPGCEVAWYGEESGEAIPVSALRVRVGQKEDAPDRPACYCFGWSAADVVGEVERTGRSTIPEQVAERCRRGENRCEETNPQGSCCLGQLRALAREALARAPAAEPSCECE